MAAVLLALASSLMWGIADFSGGLLARRLPLAAVTVYSQAAGFAILLVVLAAHHEIDGRSLWLGAIGGIGGGAGLACFYAALARGTMSIVSPITACSAVVPVALSLASGERPSSLVLGGVAVSFTGAVLASFEERHAGETGRREAIPLAVGAALAIGCFVYFLGRAASDGSVLSALVGARIGSLSTLLVWALATHASLALGRRAATLVCLVGLADVTANLLFAHIVLHERITSVQRVGVAVTLVGVAIVSAA